MKYRTTLLLPFLLAWSAGQDLTYMTQAEHHYQILFVSERDGNPEIYTICSDGSGERRITDNGKTNLYPIWHSQQNTITFIYDPGDGTVIAELNPDNPGELRFLNNDPFLAYGPLQWADSEKWLLFDSFRQVWRPYLLEAATSNEYPVATNGDTATWLSKKDALVFSLPSGSLFQLADIPNENFELIAADVYITDISSSPDGNTLVFSTFQTDSSSLYLLDLEAGHIQALDVSQSKVNDPSWSPDGNWILYEATLEGTDSLYIVKTDGSNEKELIANLMLREAPIWLPDSQEILFVSTHEGNSEIYKLSVQENSVHRLTSNDAPDYMISVSANQVCE
jgi:Tol biopolymer transport system component